MKPFTSIDAAAAGLPHASASALGGTSDQTKRRGIAGLVLFVFLLFAYNATSPSVPSQNSVVRNQEVYDTSALKTGGGGGNAMDGYDVRDVDPLVNGGGDMLSSRRGFRDDKEIVVLLTSTRDGDACARSIIAARDLAFLSGRVHFRVFEEASVVHDDSCLQMYCDLRPQDCKLMLRSKRLRVVRRDISGALGASVALNLVEGMVDNKTFHDDFYLSIDTNVVFTRHWDLALLQQWYSIGNSRAILSVSPPSVETRGLNNGTFFLQCSARIHSKDKDAVVEFNPPEPKLLATVQGSGAVPLLAPVLQSQYSERFHFGPLSALQDVRSDPHLAYLVVGHEYMRATRFWTKGYDFYTPTKDIFYYRYEWPLAPHEKGKSDPFIASSSRRVRTLLGLAVSTSDGVMEDLDKYRPGDLRSLQDWRAFSSIAPDDAFNESTTNHFVNCDRRLHYVPFTLPSSAAEK